MSSSLFDGRYDILRRLGDGGYLKRFLREARSAAALNHPNVVRVYGQRRSEHGYYYIAMEYLPGGTLK